MDEQSNLVHRRRNRTFARWASAIVCLVGSLGLQVFAQTAETNSDPSTLKNLSLEELMDVEVTSVTKSPEKLLDASLSHPGLL